ncbi:hypothetical protein FACS189463_2510 [Bacteroidia bacterium]|nr:hypothetical protein FACS189463_2510 [Bacteroidia bacterium]
MQIRRNIHRFFVFLIATVIFYACASVGNPTGGDYDETPPKFLGGDPEPNALRISKSKIALQFDEFLALEKPAEKVVITPPQKKMPVIKAVGKRITVELKDSLIPNTTYTFDFTNAIVDNNEKNALEGFTYAFSTGDVVDSLVISGVLLNAEDLEPMPNILVGIHSDMSDTAFTKIPFLRTSQTNETGRFWIRNIAPGTYRLFALNDANRDFKFDQATEAIAFYDSLIAPSFEPALRQDTIWKDSLNIDTIREIHYTRFTPDDVLLRLFQEPFERQYLTKSERPNAHQFVFTFNAPVTELPKIALQNAPDFENPFLIEQSSDRKILTYWMTDSLVYQQDTLFVTAEYCAHDIDNEYITKNDTIRLITKKIQEPKKENKKNKEETVKREALAIQVTPSGTMEVFDTLRITFSEPPVDFPLEKIYFRQKVDTLWENTPLPLLRDSLNPRVLWVDQTWKYEQEYQIKIDSATIYSVYGRWNDSIQSNVKIRAEKEYGSIFVAVTGNETAGFGQILDNSGKVVKQSSIENGELAFYDLKPGKYYLRYIEDLNGNQRWDTGLYAEKLLC